MPVFSSSSFASTSPAGSFRPEAAQAESVAVPDAGISVRDAGRILSGRLRAAGIVSAEIDARLLLQQALGWERTRLLTAGETRLSAAQAEALEILARRRLAREPVSRIRGCREFWSLEFQLSPATLDPRPDSETVVETVLEAFPAAGAALRVLDLGAGSGCLLLAVLHERPQAVGVGLDLAEEATVTARCNAERLGLAARVRFVAGSWEDSNRENLLAALPLPGATATGFTAIISNPPYIPEAELATLEPEVRDYDPHLALSGGVDGLSAYRRLIPRLPSWLAAGGFVALEVGIGQAAAVAALLATAGFQRLAVRPDLAGIPRCVSGWLASARDCGA